MARKFPMAAWLVWKFLAPRPVKELMEHDGEDASEDGMDDGQGPSFKNLENLWSLGMITLF